ncbi:MAG: hypothetical protein AVDCRST_MAG91-2098 [uncultured Sphingomonadaceae bacterium]|uniref:Uncharacterized protein n=1 Tax=uncultured Sphingomonadaceae bacterium TaxID=169976 RepID=A0A6J4TCQ3_9SPHN|nr:MAG: hypothetical protein AVDCRST_MAG91-2098 [uncultured Sphingomonadaceae bacterium]
MIKPFQDDESATSIGDLSVENSTSAVVISGSLEVTRDKAGLKRARALKQFADAVVEQLEADGDLPDKVATAKAPVEEVDNPFR